MNHEQTKAGDQARTPEARESDTYARPEITDYGTLTELTLSGVQTQSDGFMTAAS